MSFRKNLFKNIIILGGYSYSTQILAFLSTIVLSRLLLPEEYGFVALITVFTGFVSTFSDAGISLLIIRSDYGITFRRVIHYLSLIIGIVLCLVVVALAYPISLFYDDRALILPTIVMSTNFIIRSVNTVPYGILLKDLKFNALGKVELAVSATNVSIMILLAFLGFSYWSLIIPHIFSNLVRNWMYHKWVSLKLTIFRKNYLLVGFRKAKSMILNLSGFTLLNYWARNTDNLIIGKVYGADSLGIYSRAYRMLTLVNSIMSSLFGKVLYPSLKDLMSKGGDVRKEYLNVLGIISLINFPVAMFLIFLAEPFVRILWSERWILVAELLPYIGVLILTQTLNSTTGNIFILFGKERTLFRLSIPINIFLIAAIAIGAIFSYVHILRFYTIAYVIINYPLVLIYGYKHSFGYTNRAIILFWAPKIVLSLLMIFSIWIQSTWVTGALSIIYFVHLVFRQRKDIASGYRFLTAKLKLNGSKK